MFPPKRMATSPARCLLHDLRDLCTGPFDRPWVRYRSHVARSLPQSSLINRTTGPRQNQSSVGRERDVKFPRFPSVDLPAVRRIMLANPSAGWWWLLARKELLPSSLLSTHDFTLVLLYSQWSLGVAQSWRARHDARARTSGISVTSLPGSAIFSRRRVRWVKTRA